MCIRLHHQPGGITGRGKRRGVLLVLTLFALTLAAALIAPLGAASGLQALEARAFWLDQRHALAVESVVALLPQLLADDRDLLQALHDRNAARFAFQLDDVVVDTLIQEESAKFPLSLAAELAADDSGASSLTGLAVAGSLPRLQWSARITPTEKNGAVGGIACLDDAFADPNDRELYGRPADAAVWSRYVTPLRSKVNIRRALPAVVEAALADIAPGAGPRIVQTVRSAPALLGLEDVLGRLGLPPAQMRHLRARLTDQPTAWSVLVRSTCQGVSRQSYVLLEGPRAERRLGEWRVAP